MSDFLVNFIMSLVTGGYMGIVVSKAVAFSNIKREALRIVRTVDTIGPNGEVFHNTDDVKNLLFLSSELLGLKHIKAANIVSEVLNQFRNEISLPSSDLSVRSKILTEAQIKIRTMPTSKKGLFNPFDFSL